MADNYAFDPSGLSVAASKDLSGVQYPRTVPVWGDASTATDIDVGASALPIQDGGNSITIDATVLPLPTGAATAAKQPSLGTAGTASTNVITVQGIAAMTALLVDGSGATQPISGAVTVTSGSITANAGTNLNTSALALESGGNLATLAGSVTSSRVAVNLIAGQSGVVGNTGVVGATTQRVTLATDVALPTGTNTIGAVTGVAAVDAAVTGNPNQVACRASRARPSAVSTDGDIQLPWLDRYGTAITSTPFATVAAGQATASGDTAAIAAPGAGSRIRVYRTEVSNSHATVAATVGFKSASVNGGSTFGKRYLPALGGAAVTSSVVYVCGDNEALNINLSVGSTTIEWTVYYDLVAS